MSKIVLQLLFVSCGLFMESCGVLRFSGILGIHHAT